MADVNLTMFFFATTTTFACIAEGCTFIAITAAISNKGSPFVWAFLMSVFHFVFLSLAFLLSLQISVFSESLTHIISLTIAIFFIFGLILKIRHIHIKSNDTKGIEKSLTEQNNTVHCSKQCESNLTYLDRKTNNPFSIFFISLGLSIDAFFHGLVIKVAFSDNDLSPTSLIFVSLLSAIQIALIVGFGIFWGNHLEKVFKTFRINGSKAVSYTMLILMIFLAFLVIRNLLIHMGGNYNLDFFH